MTLWQELPVASRSCPGCMQRIDDASADLETSSDFQQSACQSMTRGAILLAGSALVDLACRQLQEDADIMQHESNGYMVELLT